MKTRFSTLDIVAVIPEIQERLLGMRVVNVYDIDNKTYLIKLQKPDHKATLLFESGNRIHLTEFDWPKNTSPSGFSMKLRKHLKSRRLEKIEQVGIDRIIDMQFGSSEAAYHVILELYDRGNIVLTDFEYNILNILRPRTDESQDVRFAVREVYPLQNARQPEGVPSEERVHAILLSGKEGDNIKKILNPHLVYGPAVLDHCLREVDIPDNAQLGKQLNISDSNQFQKIMTALQKAESLVESVRKCHSKGFIIQKQEKKPGSEVDGSDVLVTNIEFHPILFHQHQNSPVETFDSFHTAIDTFFSNLESQKLDMKALQWEKSAVKKLENVKKDHGKRLDALQREQELDTRKGQLIEMNLPLVERAITIVRSAVANQIDWTEINQIVKEAQSQGDQVAGAIKGLNLDKNHMSLLLKDICVEDDEAGKPVRVDIDLGLSAYANARKYFDMKRHAAQKEQKTIDASQKALKSAEKKTKQTLKEVATAVKIHRARKTHWFEKFLWFISSENYLVIGGRDQQQNELIVKKYLKSGDLYVHADLHGASSVIIKNPSGEPVSPKSLNEAGTMAVCNSAAWEAKVVTSAWWVYHHQVSKTAPTGEYLTTGSFMIRGKKNYLPPCYLVYGFGFVFRVDEDSIHRHKDERKVRKSEDVESIPGDLTSEVNLDKELNLVELEISDSDNESGADVETTASISEQVEEQVESSGIEDIVKVVSMKRDEEEDDEDSGQNDNDAIIFPDTSISLQHVEGDRFILQHSISQTSESTLSEQSQSDDIRSENMCGRKTGRLSAHQKRQMKKVHEGKLTVKSEEYSTITGSGNLPEADNIDESEVEQLYEKQGKGSHEQQPQQHMKRGQKAKLKKMKAKYGDQDEEERQLKMEILASAGAKKPEKQKGKKNKQKQKQQDQKATRFDKQVEPSGKSTGKDLGGKLNVQEIKTHEREIKTEVGIVREDTKSESIEKLTMTKEPEEAMEEEDQIEDQQQNLEDVQVLQSITGIPHAEDTLLYCIPVCGPYTALLNYKFKVKLIPGSTKRGKAAKHSYNLFLHDRSITNSEKDVLKVIKDDMSRNIPGRVKIAAQGISKVKKKK